jgi:predicted phosphodiesterase
MIKIRILSDLHYETIAHDLKPRLPDVDCDLVIIAGDYNRADRCISHARSQFPEIPLVLVAGNHEHYRTGHPIPANLKALKDDAQRDCSENNRLTYFLENETIVLSLSTAKVRVIGATLWTDFRLFGTTAQSIRFADEGMNDYVYIKSTEPSRDVLRPIETVRYHHESCRFIEKELQTPFEGSTIVVTHHLPSMRSVSAKYTGDDLTPAFASDCDALLALGADLWIHGHTHDSCDYMAGKTRVLCNPHGYYAGFSAFIPENRFFNSSLVVEV